MAPRRKKTGPQLTIEERLTLTEVKIEEQQASLDVLELKDEQFSEILSFFMGEIQLFTSRQAEEWEDLANRLDGIFTTE